MRKRLQKKLSACPPPKRLSCCGAKFKKLAGGSPYVIGYQVHSPRCPESLQYRRDLDKATDRGSFFNGSEIVDN